MHPIIFVFLFFSNGQTHAQTCNLTGLPSLYEKTLKNFETAKTDSLRKQLLQDGTAQFQKEFEKCQVDPKNKFEQLQQAYLMRSLLIGLNQLEVSKKTKRLTPESCANSEYFLKDISASETLQTKQRELIIQVQTQQAALCKNLP
jgi:hypothetical protein